MYYLCSENKGADQLRGYREADLHLFFAYAKSRFSHNATHLVHTELVLICPRYIFELVHVCNNLREI